MPTPGNRSPRFAIIGCGLIGNKRSAALPAGSLVAACDVVAERARALAARSSPSAAVASDIDDALSMDIDAVIIATQNADLAPIALKCLQAGKHVLIEKPVAISVADVDRLAACAERRRLLVRAGYNHRFHPAFRQARKIFEAGELGPLMFVRGRYGHGGRVGYHREWRANPKISGGGELIDQGVHLIDLAGWFLGTWTSIEGHTATYYWDMPVDDNAFLLLRNACGNMAWLHASCTEWKNLFSFEIYGKNAKLHIEGLGGSYGTERLYHYHMLPEMGPPQTVIYEFPGNDNSWFAETAEFIEDIRLDRKPVPGLNEARAALQVVEAIYVRCGYPRQAASVVQP